MGKPPGPVRFCPPWLANNIAKATAGAAAEIRKCIHQAQVECEAKGNHVWTSEREEQKPEGIGGECVIGKKEKTDKKQELTPDAYDPETVSLPTPSTPMPERGPVLLVEERKQVVIGLAAGDDYADSTRQFVSTLRATGAFLVSFCRSCSLSVRLFLPWLSHSLLVHLVSIRGLDLIVCRCL